MQCIRYKLLVSAVTNKVFMNYKKQQILHFYQLGHKPPTIQKALAEEGLKVSRQGIAMFLK